MDNTLGKRRSRVSTSISLPESEAEKFLVDDWQEMDTYAILTDRFDTKSSPGSDLHTSFFEVLQCYSGSHDILEIVSSLTECCSNMLQLKQDENLYREMSLESERNIWRLLFILYQDRLVSQTLTAEEDRYFGKSEKLCAENLYKYESLVRESQLVIDWLEWCTSQRDQKVAFFSDNNLGWENTLHQLQSEDTIAFRTTTPIVKELHPDAPHREERALHDLDQDDEKRLSQGIFRKIREGKLEEAQQLCRNGGQSWKAAIFEGWRLFHNPNLEENTSSVTTEITSEDDSNNLKDIEGNDNRDIWKNIALNFCQQDYLNIYEKASVGSFCGYLKAMLPVCKSWEDNLWAYMKTMVDIRVESEIRDCVVRKKYLPLPEEYWSQRMSINEVFTCLESSKNEVVRRESANVASVIQKYIILDEISVLMSKLEEWIEDVTVSFDFLRFLAHLVLFFDHTSQSHDREVSEKVLKRYITELMKIRNTQLVAFYTSKLRPTNQVRLYATYLETIAAPKTRKYSLTCAENCNLNVIAITKQVVENIRAIPHDVQSDMSLGAQMTLADLQKISALDWLLFYDEHKVELLIQSNAVIFTFLALGKVAAAKRAFSKVPPDTIKKVLSDGRIEAFDRTIKEHLCYKAYLDAQEAFIECDESFANQPTQPDKLSKNASFPEKVSYEHRVAQYKSEIERWRHSFAYLVKKAKTALYNVLLFPEGWLSDSKERECLRCTCIPEMVFLLYTVLCMNEEYQECVQLADIVASPRYKLYEVFSKEKLGEFNSKLSEASVALMALKKDPWGYESSA